MSPIAVTKPKAPNPPPEAKGRAVFGISKEALMEEGPKVGGEADIQIKAGNTLAVAPDDKKLEPGDALLSRFQRKNTS